MYQNTSQEPSRHLTPEDSERARAKAIGRTDSTALERLYAEELPTGRFGGRTAPSGHLTPERATANRAALDAAISRRTRRPKATAHYRQPRGTRTTAA